MDFRSAEADSVECCMGEYVTTGSFQVQTGAIWRYGGAAGKDYLQEQNGAGSKAERDGAP